MDSHHAGRTRSHASTAAAATAADAAPPPQQQQHVAALENRQLKLRNAQLEARLLAAETQLLQLAAVETSASSSPPNPELKLQPQPEPDSEPDSEPEPEPARWPTIALTVRDDDKPRARAGFTCERGEGMVVCAVDAGGAAAAAGVVVGARCVTFQGQPCRSWAQLVAATRKTKGVAWRFTFTTPPSVAAPSGEESSEPEPERAAEPVAAAAAGDLLDAQIRALEARIAGDLVQGADWNALQREIDVLKVLRLQVTTSPAEAAERWALDLEQQRIKAQQKAAAAVAKQALSMRNNGYYRDATVPSKPDPEPVPEPRPATPPELRPELDKQLEQLKDQIGWKTQICPICCEGVFEFARLDPLRSAKYPLSRYTQVEGVVTLCGHIFCRGCIGAPSWSGKPRGPFRYMDMPDPRDTSNTGTGWFGTTGPGCPGLGGPYGGGPYGCGARIRSTDPLTPVADVCKAIVARWPRWVPAAKPALPPTHSDCSPMDMQIGDDIWFAVISSLVRPHPAHESRVGPSVTEYFPKLPDLVQAPGGCGGYVCAPDTLPKWQRRSLSLEGIKHLGQLARTSKKWLSLVLRWSETLAANRLPAVQNVFSRVHDERLSYYAEIVEQQGPNFGRTRTTLPQTLEGERRLHFNDALFGGTAKDRCRSRLERCMLVAMLTILPNPEDLYMHPSHDWVWECETHDGAGDTGHTLAACKDSTASVFTAPYGLKETCFENGGWFRFNPGPESKGLDFQALQIDYYYGPFDPRLRLDPSDRRTAIESATELDGNEYEGDDYRERRLINRKLGLNPECFRDQHADPLHGVDMNPYPSEPYYDRLSDDDAADEDLMYEQQYFDRDDGYGDYY
jgi:hypothetical protein